jgi:hypothetical protein
MLLLHSSVILLLKYIAVRTEGGWDFLSRLSALPTIDRMKSRYQRSDGRRLLKGFGGYDPCGAVMKDCRQGRSNQIGGE